MAFSNFVSNFKNMFLGTESLYYDLVVPSLITGNGVSFDYLGSADKIATVMTCIKTLSDTISKLPLNIYSDIDGSKPVDKSHYLYPILHYQPNTWCTSQTFMASLEFWRNLKGNSFAKIYRNGLGQVTSLVLIPPSRVCSYSLTNDQLYYVIKNDKDKEETINASDILHFKTLTKDGVWGVNPIESLRLNISSTYQGLNTIDKFYQNNAASPKALKSTVSGANQKAIIEALGEFQVKYSGSSNAGKIIPLPPNTELFDLALNYADAEFINTLKFNVTQIGALYGVPAFMLGILESTKFANVEQLGLDFRATTLSAIGRMYRMEFESKLLTTDEQISGISIEFNYDAVLEVDSATRINNLRTLANLGVLTPDDIAKMEGFPTNPNGGDKHYIPGNYLTIEEISTKPANVQKMTPGVAPTTP